MPVLLLGLTFVGLKKGIPINESGVYGLKNARCIDRIGILQLKTLKRSILLRGLVFLSHKRSIV